MADPDVKIKVSTTESGGLGALDRTKAALARVREEGGLAGKAIEGLGRISLTALGGMATAAGAVQIAFQTAARAIREFAEAEEHVASLDAALARRGQLTAEYRARLQELAGTMESMTAVADDEWLGVLTRLAQFGVDPDSMEGAVEAVKNLAGVTGSLQSATELYVRALQGNFGALSRYGIVLDETASKVEKLNQLHQIAATVGGGQMEARAESLSGKFRNLSNQSANLLETMGGIYVLFSGLGNQVTVVSDAFEWWAKTLGGTIPKLEGITNALGPQAEALQRAAESARLYAEHLETVRKLSDAVVTTLERETKALREKAKAQDELASEQMAIDIASVDEEVASGSLSNVEGLRRKQAIRTRYREEDFQREQSMQEAEIALLEKGKSDVAAERERVRAEREKAEDEYARNAKNPPPRISDNPEEAEKIRREIAEIRDSGDAERKKMLPELLDRYQRVTRPGYDFDAAKQRIGQMRGMESSLATEYDEISARVDPRIADLREGKRRGADIFQMRERRYQVEGRVEMLSAGRQESGGRGELVGQAQAVAHAAADARGSVSQLLSRTMEDLQALTVGQRGNLMTAEKNRREIENLKGMVKDHANR